MPTISSLTPQANILCLPNLFRLFLSQLLEETAQATKLVAERDNFKVSIKKARMGTMNAELELKDQTALVSKLRLEKQELHVSAEREALDLHAKLAAITVEVRDKGNSWTFVKG